MEPVQPRTAHPAKLGPGPSFAPEVRGFNYDDASITAIAAVDFNAFVAAQYGVFLAGGNVDADSFDEILCTPGPGPTLVSRFLGFNYDNASVGALAGFDVTPFATYYGGRVGSGEVTGDATFDLIAGAGPGPAAASEVKPYSYNGASLTPVTPTFVPFGGTYGVVATAGALGH